MFSMVLVGSGSVSFDTDPDSGSSHFFYTDPDPGKWYGFHGSGSGICNTACSGIQFKCVVLVPGPYLFHTSYHDTVNCQDVRLRDEGAAGPGVRPVPRGPAPDGHQRPLHGRPRGHGGPPQESRKIRQRLRQHHTAHRAHTSSSIQLVVADSRV